MRTVPLGLVQLLCHPPSAQDAEEAQASQAKGAVDAQGGDQGPRCDGHGARPLPARLGSPHDGAGRGGEINGGAARQTTLH